MSCVVGLGSQAEELGQSDVPGAECYERPEESVDIWDSHSERLTGIFQFGALCKCWYSW